MEEPHSEGSFGRTSRWFLVGCWVAVAVVYLLQLASPLRLNTDAIVYIRMADNFLAGKGLTFHGWETFYPSGYPLLLAGLISGGLGVSWSFILVNLLGLTMSLLSAHHLFRRAWGMEGSEAWRWLLLVPFSWVVVKHTTLPVTDVLYLGLSFAALACLAEAEDRPRPLPLAGFFVLAFLAIWVRSVGIALWAAAALLLAMRLSPRLWRRSGTPARVWMTTGTVGLLTVVGWAIVGSGYFQSALDMLGPITEWPLSLGRLWLIRLQELGEVTGNLPSTQLPTFLHPVLVLGGLVAGAALVFAARKQLRRPKAPDLYLVVYGGILALWPFQDPRFWIPVIPLLAVWVPRGFQEISPRKAARWVGTVWLAGFLLAGSAALVYSTRISLAGERFPERYGSDGLLRPTYRVAFGQSREAETEGVNQDALELLRRHEVRARRESSR